MDNLQSAAVGFSLLCSLENKVQPWMDQSPNVRRLEIMNALQAEDDLNAYSNFIFIALGIGLLYTVLVTRERRYAKLKHIPTAGHNQYIPSCLDALRYLTDCPRLLKKAYKDCQHRVFRISTFHGWKVLISDSHHVEELRKAPEQAVSLSAAAHDPRTKHYLLGHCQGGMTTELVSEWARCLTQNLAHMLPGTREEVVASVNASIANSATEVQWKTPSNEGWHRVKATDIVEETVSRVVNRAFFGQNVSRDKLYSQLSAASVRDACTFSIVTHIISLAPKALSWLGSLFRPSVYRQWRMRTRLSTIVRSENETRQGLGSQKAQHDQLYQFDLCSHLFKDEDVELFEKNKTMVQLLVESSVKSTQMISPILLQVLRRLAASSEDVASMRSEINNVVSREGWTSLHTLEKLRKIDSFIKEAMRVDGFSALSTMRKTVTPFTFLDGTYIPPDTLLFSNAYARHHDASIYPAPGTFNGSRFWAMHEEHCKLYEGGCSCVRFGLTTTSTSFLAWGHGRHACPGRFFASAVMKMILVEIVIRWDVRFEDGATQQDDFWVGDMCLPNREVEILVRARPQ